MVGARAPPAAAAAPAGAARHLYRVAPVPSAYRPHRRLAARARPAADGDAPPAAAAAAAAAAVDPAASDLADDPSCFGVGTELQCVLEDEESGAMVSVTASRDAGAGAAAPPRTLLQTAVLVSPFFFWGSSMVAMKGLDLPPLLVAAWRLIPAGAALLLWARAAGRPALPRGAVGWAAVAAFALVDGTAFQGCLAEGLQRTGAGLGSVIIDSQPLSVAVLAAALFGERLGGAQLAGLAAGVAGLALLELPPPALAQLLEHLGGGGAAGDVAAAVASTAPAGAADGLDDAAWSVWDSGEFWMLLAAQSMAVGTVMVRWVARHCDPVAATAWHMLLGGLPLLAAALAQLADGGGPAAGAAALGGLAAALSPADAAALLYISLLGSAASYGVFFLEAQSGNLTALSSLTFLTPCFAAAGGYLVLGETLGPAQLGGAALTLAAVALLQRRPAAAKGD